LLESVLFTYVSDLPFVDLRLGRTMDLAGVPATEAATTIAETVGEPVAAIADCAGRGSPLRRMTDLRKTPDGRDFYTIWLRGDSIQLQAPSVEGSSEVCVVSRSDGDLWSLTIGRPRSGEDARPSVAELLTWAGRYTNGREILHRAHLVDAPKVIGHRHGWNSWAGYSTWRGLAIPSVAAAGDSLVELSPILGVGASMAARSAEFVASHLGWLIADPMRFGRAWHSWQAREVEPWFAKAVRASDSELSMAITDGDRDLRDRHLVS
jgi:hypothetical protein